MRTFNDRLAILVHWIREREAIRGARAAGKPAPWTSDPILANYRFCNVDREDDKVTRWIDQNIRQPWADHPRLLFNLVLARYVNDIEALTRGGFVQRWGDGLDWVARIQGDGTLRQFGNAYIIPCGREKAKSKLHWLAKYCFTPVWHTARSYRRDWQSCEQMYNFLTMFKSCGPFLGNQIVTDAKYTPLLRDAPDKRYFIQAGPGTCRGLARLFNGDVTHGVADERTALMELRGILIYNTSTYRITLPAHAVLAFERDINNVSNCMCEYDKYMRARLKEGEPKQRYVP